MQICIFSVKNQLSYIKFDMNTYIYIYIYIYIQAENENITAIYTSYGTISELVTSQSYTLTTQVVILLSKRACQAVS